MFKQRPLSLLLAFTMLMPQTLAQTTRQAENRFANIIDFNQLFETNFDTPTNVTYVHFNGIAENSTVERPSGVDFFFTQINSASDDEGTIAWFKQMLEEEKSVNENVRVDFQLIAPEGRNLENSQNIRGLLRELRQENSQVLYDYIPREIAYKDQNGRSTQSVERNPSNLGRFVITAYRVVMITGLIYYKFTASEEIHPTVAVTMGLIAGVASGSLAWNGDRYHDWLHGNYEINWLLESNHPAARNLRNVFGIPSDSTATWIQYLERNKASILRKNPHLTTESLNEIIQTFRTNPELITTNRTTQLAPELLARRQRLRGRLALIEPYFKWYMVDVLFTAVAAVIPQAIFGITDFSQSEYHPLLQMVGNTFITATAGFAAQGPADIGFGVWRRNAIIRLKERVERNQIQVLNPEILIAEINEIAADRLEIANATHPSIKRISNIARFAGASLSILIVAGVVAQAAEIPHSEQYLFAIGIPGVIFFASVKGFIPVSRISRASRDYISHLGNIATDFKNYFLRTCSNKFRRRH